MFDTVTPAAFESLVKDLDEVSDCPESLCESQRDPTEAQPRPQGSVSAGVHTMPELPSLRSCSKPGSASALVVDTYTLRELLRSDFRAMLAEHHGEVRQQLDELLGQQLPGYVGSKRRASDPRIRTSQDKPAWPEAEGLNIIRTVSAPTEAWQSPTSPSSRRASMHKPAYSLAGFPSYAAVAVQPRSHATSPVPPPAPGSVNINAVTSMLSRSQTSTPISQMEQGGESRCSTPSIAHSAIVPNTPGKTTEVYDEDERQKRLMAERQSSEKMMRLHLYSTSNLEDHLDRWRLFRQWLKVIVNTHRFDLFIAIVILSNAGFIGVQVEYKAQMGGDTMPLAFKLIQALYCFVFVGELSLRLVAFGPIGYFFSQDFAWNWFDFIVVMISLIEIGMELVMDASDNGLRNIAVMRIGRAIRIVRIMRVIRVMRFFRHLRILMVAIFSTVKSSVWTLCLLFMIIYTFGVVFTQGTTDLMCDQGVQLTVEKEATLRDYFGTLPRAMLTLFMSLCGGIDWENAMLSLDEISWFMVVLFLIYISFVYFAVMNVVTGLFCQSAIESAQADKDAQIHDQMKATEKHIETLKALFKDIDTNNSGIITLKDFEEKLSNKKVTAFFKTIEIDIIDAWTLFKLLDVDGGGTVDLQEFVQGCLQVTGNAKSIHAAKMMYENKWIMDKLTEISQNMHQECARAEERNRGFMRYVSKAVGDNPDPRAGQSPNSVLARSPMPERPRTAGSAGPWSLAARGELGGGVSPRAKGAGILS